MTEKKYPTEVIDLPSHGWFYDKENPLSSGQIELKYPTAREEDILTSTNLVQKGVAIDRLLQSIIVDDVNYDDLLIGDKSGVMIAARILAYGKDYPVTVACPNCNNVNRVKIDLTEFEEREIAEPSTKGVNEFNFQLPVSKLKVTFKLLTHKDEMEIDRELRKLEEANLSGDVDHTLSTRIKYSITSVDGDSSNERIRQFVDEEMLSRDSRAFRNHYASVSPDIETKATFECEKCEKSSEVEVSLGIDFFWPDAGV